MVPINSGLRKPQLAHGNIRQVAANSCPPWTWFISPSSTQGFFYRDVGQKRHLLTTETQSMGNQLTSTQVGIREKRT
jgi:hypothetical protein